MNAFKCVQMFFFSERIVSSQPDVEHCELFIIVAEMEIKN